MANIWPLGHLARILSETAPAVLKKTMFSSLRARSGGSPQAATLRSVAENDVDYSGHVADFDQHTR